jgi:hypothetical protein
MNTHQQQQYARLTDEQRNLIDQCKHCDEFTGDCQTVNDVQWMQNRIDLREWAHANGYTQEQVTKALVWRRKHLT